jgi:stage V sporulation protein B
MSKKETKQTFLGGAAVLAAAVIVVKLIGAIYKIPLGNIIGAQGKTYFDGAYRIYNVLLTISTAGFPLAISKLTSEAHALGRENEKHKLFRTSIWLFFAMGAVGSLLMFFGARELAAFVNIPKAYWPIKALSPAVFCVCLLACMRGYTQGQGNMKPTAVSQVLEALCKLFIGLTLAYYLYRVLGKGREFGAAGAILGVTSGTLLSMLFLMFYLMHHRDREKSLDAAESSGALIKKVLAIGIPITLSNSVMSIITLVDMKIIIGRLETIPSLAKMADTLYGRYSFGMDLINLPASFVYPVTMSLIPFAAAALARHDNKEAARTVNSAFRLIAILAFPCGVGLSVLSTPIMLTLYPSQRSDALAAGALMRILGLACIVICVVLLSNAILQTYGHVYIPVCTMVVGGFVKVMSNYFLVGNARINIHGAPYSTLCCYSAIAVLNLFFVWKYSPEKPHYAGIFLKPAVAAAAMGGAVWVSHSCFARLLAGHSAYMATAASTFLSILVGILVYVVLVVALGVLRAEDVKNMKKGEKLIRILHLK